MTKPYEIRPSSWGRGCFSWMPRGASLYGHASREKAERAAEAHYQVALGERDGQWRELLQRTADYCRQHNGERMAKLLERLAAKGPVTS